MALVALNSEQKEELKQSQRFLGQVEWAVINKAQYWIGLDGASVPGNDHVKWAKSRFFASNNIINNIVNIDGNREYHDLFLLFLTHPVWENTVPFNVDTVIDYMNTNGTFEAVADSVYDQKIKPILF